ncbi:hypothetical protein GE061_007882 [Apolygus lucorum]|uniref:Uncharacterized protein n=1 Tax=Apolygus lucorum TaxID=248454 RepID=A0A8S9WRV2_APOLU|nr:hypothetical protein GE061_007882 [Apolygus lucorum]
MGDEIVVKQEQMEEEEATEDQVMFEFVAIKQEALSGDELVDEEVGNGERVEDEVAGYPMIKQELESTDGSHSDGGDVLLGSIGVQSSEAGPSIMVDEIVVKEELMVDEIVVKEELMVDEIVVKEELMVDEIVVKEELMVDEIVVKEELMEEEEATEDQVMFEFVAIKQEALSGDEHVYEEVGNGERVEDEIAGYPMIKQELESTDGSHSDGGDVLLGSIGVQRSEAGPSRFRPFGSRYANPATHLNVRALFRRFTTCSAAIDLS